MIHHIVEALKRPGLSELVEDRRTELAREKQGSAAHPEQPSTS
jgi:hypothetical protein